MYNDPSDRVLTVAQMRANEAQAVARGTSVDELMQRAGKGAAELIYRLAWPGAVTVLCGPGNNGGDGYVIAEELRRRGLTVRLFAPLEPATAAARKARAAWQGEIMHDPEEVYGGTFVDCLFGSGLARPIADDLWDLLKQLGYRHDRLIAVDVPSGIDCDAAEAIDAWPPQFDLTIALGAWKYAHWLCPAMSCMGERRLVEIGLAPLEFDEDQPDLHYVSRLSDRPRFEAPWRQANKYSRGLMAVVGGRMPGAALLAAQAAMRSGAGYVKLLAQEPITGAPPDLVIETGDLGELMADDRYSTFVVGPGLGRDELARARLEAVLARGMQVVIDADALRLFTPGMVERHATDGRWVLTPHAGELAQLYDTFSVPEGERCERLGELASRANATIVAKGPDTVVASPSGTVSFAANAAPPTWLSVAGSGDVLAGIIASHIEVAKTGDYRRVACDALWLHAEAARMAGPAFTPMDLIHAIPDAYASFL